MAWFSGQLLKDGTICEGTPRGEGRRLTDFRPDYESLDEEENLAWPKFWTEW